MKKLLLVLFGLAPFIPGFLMNVVLTVNTNSAPPIQLLGIAWLLLWGFFGYLLCDCAGSPKESAALANLIAFGVLLLLLYQELILGHYWLNIFGVAAQVYYLPLLDAAFRLTAWAHRVWPAYVVSFALMFAVFYLGCRIRKSRAE